MFLLQDLDEWRSIYGDYLGIDRFILKIMFLQDEQAYFVGDADKILVDHIFLLYVKVQPKRYNMFTITPHTDITIDF